MSSLARRCRRGEAAACRQLARRRRAEEEARLFSLVSPPPDDDGGETEPEPDLRLKYSPPDYSGYTVINVPASGAGANGSYQQTLTADTDYIINFPDELRVGNVTLIGGRNIVIIGGEIETVDISTITEADQDRRALYFINQTGDIFIEGMHFHANSAGDHYDCIHVRDDAGTIGDIYLQNVLMEDVNGTSAGWHGDGVQFQDTSVYAGSVYIDKWTVYGDYQAWYQACDGTTNTVTFNRCNWVVTAEQGVKLWMGDNGTDAWSRKTSTFGDGCYLAPFSGGTLDDEVRPNSACSVADERPVINSGVMTWPNSNYITGSLNEGTPPDGDYVPAESVGVGYVSPGYQE